MNNYSYQAEEPELEPELSRCLSVHPFLCKDEDQSSDPQNHINVGGGVAEMRVASQFSHVSELSV